jgi:hypothetical protein
VQQPGEHPGQAVAAVTVTVLLLMAVLVVMTVLVLMTLLVVVSVLVAAMAVIVVSDGRIIHGFSMRQETRFRTSTITRYVLLQNGRSNRPEGIITGISVLFQVP